MIGEIAKQTFEVEKETTNNKLAFNPDKRIDSIDKNIEYQETSRYNPDERLQQDRLYTTSDERKSLASRSDGKWKGEPGNSEFIPNKIEAQQALKAFGQDYIKYMDGNPDFSKCSIATVNIDNMSSCRERNFKLADMALAEKWNVEGKDDRSDWTGREVSYFRKANRFSWHERIDKKTMDLVQRDIHTECKHFGGVAECLRMERKGEQFYA